MAPNQTLTAAFAYDGERGVLTNHRSTAAPQRPTRNNTGTTVQYEAISGARVAGRRHSLREQRQLRLLCRASRGGVVAGESRERGARRHSPSRQRRTRHQGAAVYSVLQPVAQLPRQSRSETRAIAGIRRRRRAALRARSRWTSKSTYFANHFDDLISLGPVRSCHVRRTVREHRRNARVRPRAGGHRDRRRGPSGWRRVHAPRFESDPQHQQQPNLRAWTSACTGGRVTPARCRRRSRAIDVSATLGGVFVGSRVDTDFNFPTISSNEGYATWNASGEVRFARRTAALHHDRQPRRSRLHGAARLSRRSGRTIRVGVRTRF